MSSREADARVAEGGVVALRQRIDELRSARDLRRAADLLWCGAALAIADVRSDGVVEEVHVLGHDRQAAAPARDVELGQWRAVNADLARRRITKPEQQVHQRGLAGAGGADDRGGLPTRDDEGHVVEGGAVAGRVGKADVTKFHAHVDMSESCRAALQVGFSGPFQVIRHVFHGGEVAVECDSRRQEVPNGPLHPVEQHEERGQSRHADTQPAAGQDQRRDQDRAGNFGQRRGHRPQELHPEDAPAQILGGLLEALDLMLLARETADEAQPRDAFPHAQAERIVFVRHLLAHRLRSPRGEADDHCARGEEHGRDRGEPSRDLEEQQREHPDGAGAHHEAVCLRQRRRDGPSVGRDGVDDVGTAVLDAVVDARLHGLPEHPGTELVGDQPVDVACHVLVELPDGVLERDAGTQPAHEDWDAQTIRDGREQTRKERAQSRAVAGISSETLHDRNEQIQSGAFQNRRRKPHGQDYWRGPAGGLRRTQ